MLKIKDNVDLKELEKFGFKDFQFIDTKKIILRRYYDFKYPNAVTDINKETRKIENWDDSFTGLGIPNSNVLLEDLYKADLVEKVEDKGE